MKYVYEMQVL